MERTVRSPQDEENGGKALVPLIGMLGVAAPSVLGSGLYSQWHTLLSVANIILCVQKDNPSKNFLEEHLHFWISNIAKSTCVLI
jgi:hypothetical protein